MAKEETIKNKFGEVFTIGTPIEKSLHYALIRYILDKNTNTIRDIEVSFKIIEDDDWVSNNSIDADTSEEFFVTSNNGDDMSIMRYWTESTYLPTNAYVDAAEYVEELKSKYKYYEGIDEGMGE